MQDTSKKAKEETRVTPVLILMGQVFYRSNENELDIDDFTPEEFDAFALTFVGEISGVKREVWDVFARAKFLNWLLGEGDIEMQEVREDGSILLVKSEIFISDTIQHETALEANGGQIK